MGLKLSRTGSKGVRRSVALTSVFSLLLLYGQFLLAGPAAAAPFTGGFSPTIFSGLADLNGDGVVTGRDDSNKFYGSTHIIDGKLDCNAWGVTPNSGAAGSGVIDGNDDCTLRGYDGTADGVTIDVVDGVFQVANGPLPTVFNAADPDNPDVGDSNFAWSTIGGRVDSNGNETIDPDDCTFGLIGVTVDAGLGDPTDGADILGSDSGCGFATTPPASNNGLVDLNSDGNITAAADSCTNFCFFGLNVNAGFVQAPASPPPPPPPSPSPFTGGFSPTIFSGKADLNGDNVVTGRDDSNRFYGDTSIIDGKLDCDAWGVTPNSGAAGSLVIDGNDDCTLRGYDGTADGVTIDVVDGVFQVANGPLPTVFNAAEPDNPDVGPSDFAWSTIGGRVDSNGDETIDGTDCTFGLIGVTVDAGAGDMTDGADILGSDPGCGFATPPPASNNGLVDLNSDGNITAAADSCTNFCFFGHNVNAGFVYSAAVASLTINPPDATNNLGTTHIVVATAKDANGDPTQGTQLIGDKHKCLDDICSSIGPFEDAQVESTDANGQASFIFPSPSAAGRYVIHVYVDNPPFDGTPPPETEDTPRASAFKTWAVAGSRPAIYRLDSSGWYLRNTLDTGQADNVFKYGNAGDKPVFGDWNGDGLKTPGILRNGRFFLRNSNDEGVADVAFYYGNPGDIPLAGDWDGDGVDGVGVFRPSEGKFYLRNSLTSGVAQVTFFFGNGTDLPVTGDWDGNGTDTVGVVRNGQWFLNNQNDSSGPEANFYFGNGTDVPVVGDWDASGGDSAGVYRNGFWFYRNPLTTGTADNSFEYGEPGDKPLTWNAV